MPRYRQPQTPHGVPNTMRSPASIEEPNEINPFLVEDQQVLPSVHYPGVRFKWVRVGLGGEVDLENLQAHQFQKLRYEITPPDHPAVENLRLLTTKLNGVDGNCIRYRDVVLMHTSEKLARQFEEAQYYKAERQMGLLKTTLADQFGSRFKSSQLVYGSQHETEARNVVIDE